MKLGTLLVITAVVSIVFGIAFILAPEQLLALYGMKVPAAGLFLGRLFGAALVTVGLIDWLARDFTDAAAQHAVVLPGLVGTAVGFVVALLGQLGGVSNALGWTTVAIYGLLALGFAWFQFAKRTAAAPA